jgi:single-strand DNA-binding protein
MINSATIVGYVGQDAKVFKSEKGSSTAKFSVACNERWRDDSKDNERTHWIGCVAYGRWAEFCEQYVQRGTRLAVSGSLQYSEWQDKGGNKRNQLELKVLGIELLSPNSKKEQ